MSPIEGPRARALPIFSLLVGLALLPPPAEAGIGDSLDVKLGGLTDASYVHRQGTFPNGRVGMSMATTACNVGTMNVPWEAPMDEDHPSIAMQLYREMNGRFEQIGVSWMKHGFSVVSEVDCGPCLTPSPTFDWLGVGCSDTYEVVHNTDPFWLGPRDEVNPFTGRWTCSNSYFSGYQPDCGRRQPVGGVDIIERVVQTWDSELGLPGATYYYEAFYHVPDDMFIPNNLGSRVCTMSWTGSQWSFQTPLVDNLLLEGPALQRWGEMQSWGSVGPNDGDVLLAVQTTDLGAGLWQYEYALFNLSSDRQIRSFQVPLDDGRSQTAEFRDWDHDASNDWARALAGGIMRWETESFAQNPDANALAFGLLFNFGFIVDDPPVEGTALLDMWKPGAGGDVMLIPILAPSSETITVGEGAPIARPRIGAVRPNPTQAGTRVAFELPEVADVDLHVYDATGRLVRALVEGVREAGRHEAAWDGRDGGGREVAAGVYHARLAVDGAPAAGRKIVIVR